MRCEPTSSHPFVSEPVTLTKKNLGFWIGLALWIDPPLLPLLVLIVFSIRDVPSEGQTATIAHHAMAEAPTKLSQRSSSRIGPAGERHSKRNVLFGARAKFGIHSNQRERDNSGR